MKIAYKISLAFVAVTATCAFAALGSFYYIARASLSEAVEKRLHAVSQARAAHIRTYLGMLKTSVNQLSRSVVLEQFAAIEERHASARTAEFKNAMYRLASTKDANQSVQEFFLLDRSGTIIASTEPIEIGQDRSTADYFIRGRNAPCVLDARHAETGLDPTLFAAAPLNARTTGEFLGVLVAEVRLNELWRILGDEAGMGDTGEIYLLNRDGIFISPLRFMPDAFAKKMVFDTGFGSGHDRTSLWTTSSPTMDYRDYRGKQVIGVHEPISEMGWTVVSKIDKDEALAPLAHLRTILYEIALLMALGALLASLMLNRTISRRLDKLLEGAAIIGRGDFSHKVGSGESDEIGQLSRAFDAMSANLKVSTASVHDLNREIAQRKQTEERLREMSMIQERSPVIIFLWKNAEGWPVEFVSKNVAALFGYTAEDFISGKVSYSRIVHPDDLDRVASEVKRNSDDKSTNSFTHKPYRIVARDGQVKWIFDSTVIRRDASGLITHYEGVIADITERKRAEELLAGQLRFLDTLLQTVPIPIFYKDRAGRYTGCNGAFAEFLGRPAADIIGKTVFELSPPELAAEYHRKDCELFERAGRQTYEFKAQRSDGTARSVIFYKATLLDAEGQIIGLIGAIIDVTERRQVEETLRRNEERTRLLLDSTAEAIYGLDMQGNCTFCNKACLRLLGYQRAEELIGKNMHLQIHHKRPDGSPFPVEECRIFQAIQKGEGTHADDEVLWRADGVPFPTEYWSYPQIQDGKVVGSVVTFLDITERRRNEQNLRESRRQLENAYRQLQQALEAESRLTVQAQAASSAKSLFVANISHEIRTPLNGIIGICELLLETRLSAEQLEYARAINSSAEALMNLVNATLDFSKIEAGKMTLESIDFNLKTIIEDIASILAVGAEKKHLRLFTHCAPDVPVELNGDPGRLRQVLFNLIGNAIKFTESGEISVRAELAGQDENSATVRFSVKDTGIGIPPEKTKMLFNAFSQLDSSVTRQYGGTGLGLAISKGLVEQMGGTIGVESIPGQGSNFWFVAPFRKSRPGDKAVPAAAELPGDADANSADWFKEQRIPRTGRPLRILVAEDNMVNQMVILGILAKMGHSAVAVANGAEAVKALETITYDLVLMDLQMPEMDGFEASSIVRNPHSRVLDHNVPILALSAHTRSETEEKCSAVGIDGYISKPVNARSLARLIDSVQPAAFAADQEPAPGEESLAAFDDRVLAANLSGEAEIIREILSIFLSETPKRIAELLRHVKARSQDEAVRVAHTLKGSSANVGAKRVNALAGLIENACGAGEWRRAEALLPKLSRQFEQAEKAMRAYLKRPQGA